MIKRSYLLAALLAIMLLSSCGLIGDIFKAGYYVGTFTILAVLVFIFGLFYYIGKR